MPVIKVTDFILFNGSVLFIKDFEVIKILDYKITDVDYLEEKDYEDLKAMSMPNPNLPQTPIVVKKKLTNKAAENLQIPARAASHRNKQNKHCGSC